MGHKKTAPRSSLDRTPDVTSALVIITIAHPMMIHQLTENDSDNDHDNDNDNDNNQYIRIYNPLLSIADAIIHY